MKGKDFLVIALLLFLLYVISKELDLPDRWQKLKSLQPSVRNKFYNFLHEIETKLGYTVLVTSSHREFYEQAKLHKEDPRNAPAGSSTHELDTGIDFVLYTPAGRMIGKKSPKYIWEATGVPALAKEYGFRWGGDFKNYFDPVHYDLKLVA